MRDWRVILGRNVRRIRQQRGLTQEQLAFEANIDLTYMGGIERGKRNPSLLVMARIADALSVSLIRLFADWNSQMRARQRTPGWILRETSVALAGSLGPDSSLWPADYPSPLRTTLEPSNAELWMPILGRSLWHDTKIASEVEGFVRWPRKGCR
jgi:transcriptional regulator with XRE-family HTH domain